MFAFANRWLGATRLEASKAPSSLRHGFVRDGATASLEAITYQIAQKAQRGQARETATILDNLSLSIGAGEFVCLVGPSGSGKSTVLNMIAGLARPTSGRVVVAGANVRAPGNDRALVFQEAALFPWLRLRANIEFPLRVRGTNLSPGECAARSEELLRLVHLWRFRDSYPHELSGGMRQRGAIARALATDPSILLMDEPFAALDMQTRELLQTELERIWLATGKTIVFVTHNVREAVRLGDRVVLMGTRPGRILSDIAVTLPRPRAVDDPEVVTLTRDVAGSLASEVDKVAREEADDAWVAPGDRVRPRVRRAVGGSV
jgi:NitT/TauT family transport system ATP-binding protein